MLFKLLTIAAVLAVAVGTWYLSTQSRRTNSPQMAAQASAPGYYLRGTVLRSYTPEGAPSLKLVADRIEQIGNSRDVQLFNVRLEYQTRPGEEWTMQGDEGRVDSTGKLVQMDGHVRLVQTSDGRQNAAVIHTDEMSYDANTTEVRTDRDVQIDFGRHTLNSRGLIAHLNDRKVRLESKVNGHFQP